MKLNLKPILVFAFLFIGLITSSAQGPGQGYVRYVSSAPVGACSQYNQIQVVQGSGTIYTCQFGNWGISSGSVGSPTQSIQSNQGGTATGDQNLLWDNTHKSVTLGPTTNIGYLTLQGTPSLYSENTQTGTTGGTRGPFTIPYDFSSYLSPSADSAIELFNMNAILAIQPASTHAFTSELAGLHCEGDHNGTGTAAVLIGCAAEAYNLGTGGTVTGLTGVTSEVGSLTSGANTMITVDAFQALIELNNSTVTNANGLHVLAPGNISSTVTNMSGIKIDDQTGGGSFPNAKAINITGTQNSQLGGGLVSVGAVNFNCPTMSAPAGLPAWYCGVASPTNRIIGSAGGADFFLFNMSGAANTGTLNVGNLGGFTWSVGTANNLTADTGITRDSAAVIDVGNGTQGNKSGTINANLYTQALNGGGAQLGNATGSASTPTYAFLGTNGSSSGMYYANGNSLGFSYAGNFELGVYSSYTQIPNANGYCWTLGIASNPNTCMWRTAQGAIEFGNSNTANSNAVLSAAGYMSVGTKFTTNNGCTDNATVGGATAGYFSTGAGVTSCTEVITMGNSATAPNGWSCTAVDITTVGDVTNPHQTTSNATTATIVTGTVVAGDKIQFSCIGY